MSNKQRCYFVIDMKSFFASVECAERNLDPMTTKLVVADESRTESTVCLAVSPALRKLGVRNRCRLFEIPKSIDGIEVTSIAQGALKGCDLLEKLALPFIGENKDGSGETHFGYIFATHNSYPPYNRYLPESLKEVIITGGKSIREEAFDNCYRLTNITIPDSVTSIGSSAFA